ncbi:MAG: hypothetical protein RR212_03505 [Bacteroidales bacterium]
MIKAIFYKEWIKTRWVVVLSLLLLSGFTTFILLNLNRMIDYKGAVHIWDVMIQRDALFIELIRYIPLLAGIALAVSQYVPEMVRKCLKLTLHLPYDANRMIFLMLSYGVSVLLLIFSINYIALYSVLSSLLVKELVRHILLSGAVWFLAGIFGYLLTAWIVLEPTWKRRVVNMLISILLLKVLFFEAAGEAYNRFLPLLVLYILLSGSLAFLSVYRFKVGKQD